MDVEGRILTIETERFFFTTVYTPNAGDGLRRLDDRQLWDARYADYLAELDAKKNHRYTNPTTRSPDHKHFRDHKRNSAKEN